MLLNRFSHVCPLTSELCHLKRAEIARLVRPFEKPKAFFVHQFGEPEFLEEQIVQMSAICGIELLDAQKEPHVGVKFCKVCKLALASSFAIASLTPLNYNVFLEVGLLYGLGKKAIFLVDTRICEPSRLPFDISHETVIAYSSTRGLRSGLKRELPSFLSVHRETLGSYSPLYSFWEELLLAGGIIVAPDNREWLPGCDTVAAVAAQRIFNERVGNISGNLPCKTPDFLSRDDYSRNLVLVGGPSSNECAERVLSHQKIVPKLSYFFTRLGIRNKKTGVSYNPSIDAKTMSGYDYGLVLKTTSPWAEQSKVYFFGGYSGYGTLGGATLFTSPQLPEDCDRLNGRNLEVLIRVEVTNGRIQTPEIVEFGST